MKNLFQIPQNLKELALEELRSFVDGAVSRVREVAADPMSFVSDDADGLSIEDVKSQTAAAVESIKEARAQIATLEAETEEPAEGDGDGEEGANEDAADDGADGAVGEDAGDGAEGGDEPAAELAADLEALALEVEEPPATIVASATRPARRAPARSRQARPVDDAPPVVSLVAAAGVDGMREGSPFGDELEIARAMMDRRRRFGNVAEGSEEDVAIARADWSDQYPRERRLTMDEESNLALVASVTDPKIIRANFDARRKADAGSLVASGGLCAPVTPYYNLAMVSVAERPVRAALPTFNADRGGIRYARPATLAAIGTGVGQMTAAQDAAGGTSGTKSCQAVDCPPFQETDIAVLYHCLRFGNIGARTFPERVAQWNQLVLAAHARMAERALLTGIDAFSTQVTAASLGLGASADLLGEILVAAAGMRSRHRMAPDAVLRVLLPNWVTDLIVSDVYRSTFERWDMTPEKFVALLRQGNVEPSFYIDSAAGKLQEFGVQGAGALLPFPATTTWYLFPEGSFLFVDGGTLELGLVRDSVLNSTNDFEIFGESFENVAYIGVESLAVTSTLCDNGVTGGTHNVLCPIDYSHSS